MLRALLTIQLLPLSYSPVLNHFRPIDRPLLTTVSKPQIENGLVRISALDGRNLATFMLSERELQRLTPESGFVLEGTTTRVRMSYGLAESELLTEDTVLRRMQGAMSYKFPVRLDVNKEVNGNP